jgi:predicted DNA-binding transcriptional regulator YafY
MADDLKVSRRTVFRDLGLIRDAGLPLQYDEQGERYQLVGHPLLPATSFTPDEAMAVVVLCHEMASRLPSAFFASARNAAMKMESVLPLKMREQVRLESRTLAIQLAPANQRIDEQRFYEAVLRAATKRRSVRIRYRSLFEGNDIATKLQPYRLLFSRRSWYVIGRSSLHRSIRTFNIGRIAMLEELHEPFQVPHGFSIDRFLGNAWHLIPESGPDREVLVRFQPKVAWNVAEITWHKTQQTRFLDDGSLEFSVTVSGLNEISWWILGYGDQAEVLRPVELRNLVALHVAKLAQIYRHELDGHA